MTVRRNLGVMSNVANQRRINVADNSGTIDNSNNEGVVNVRVNYGQLGVSANSEQGKIRVKDNEGYYHSRGNAGTSTVEEASGPLVSSHCQSTGVERIRELRSEGEYSITDSRGTHFVGLQEAPIAVGRPPEPATYDLEAGTEQESAKRGESGLLDGGQLHVTQQLSEVRDHHNTAGSWDFPYRKANMPWTQAKFPIPSNETTTTHYASGKSLHLNNMGKESLKNLGADISGRNGLGGVATATIPAVGTTGIVLANWVALVNALKGG